jgi:hypothetical protein
MKLTVVPETVQTVGVPEEKDTVRPEVAVAATVYGGPPTVADGAGDVNLIDCAPLLTVKDCCSWGAGAHSLFPAWLASIVHCPAPTKLTVVPETVHTEGVPEEKATGSPEVAVAATVYGGPPTVAEGAPDVNLIVCVFAASAVAGRQPRTTVTTARAKKRRAVPRRNA